MWCRTKETAPHSKLHNTKAANTHLARAALQAHFYRKHFPVRDHKGSQPWQLNYGSGERLGRFLMGFGVIRHHNRQAYQQHGSLWLMHQRKVCRDHRVLSQPRWSVTPQVTKSAWRKHGSMGSSTEMKVEDRYYCS